MRAGGIRGRMQSETATGTPVSDVQAVGDVLYELRRGAARAARVDRAREPQWLRVVAA